MSTTAESGVGEKGTVPAESHPAEPTNTPKPGVGGLNPHDSGTPGPRDEPAPNPVPVPTAT
jgi:hypothetical protein